MFRNKYNLHLRLSNTNTDYKKNGKMKKKKKTIENKILVYITRI